jgi:hypothetical protein
LADSRHAENLSGSCILTLLFLPESAIVNEKSIPRNPRLPTREVRATPLLAMRPSEPPRHLHRQRDYGIGYGNSSGYGSEQHYVDGHVDPIFRCV